MSVAWMDAFQRDPTRYFRERFAAVTAQNQREVEASDKARREAEQIAAFARNHPLNEPPENAA